MNTTVEQQEEKKTVSEAPAADAAVVASAEPSASAPEPNKQAHCDPAFKPEMSKGEKWYNRILYQGINYWMNLGISLVITDFFIHGGGKNFFKNGVASMTKKLTATTRLKEANAKWVSEIALGTFSLNSGGNILLIPTKFIEDHKRYWVHKLNDMLGVDQTAPDGHKQTPDEIYIAEEQEPQSWPRMIGRRLLGWCATTTVGLTLDKVLAQKMPKGGHHIDVAIPHDVPNRKMGQAVFTEYVVKGAATVLNKVGANKIADNPAVKRYMGYTALDWIYTVITSKILHATNGAGKKKAPHEIGDECAPSSTTPIGDDLKPGEHREMIIVPDKAPSAVDKLRLAHQPKRDYRTEIEHNRSDKELRLTV